MLCTSLGHLYDPTESEVQVETRFAEPPTLETLGYVLSVIEEVSPKYKLTSENCFFFCSIIYENLCVMGGGQDVRGIPSKFALSLAPKARAEIDTYLRHLAPNAFPEGTYRNDYGQLLGPNGIAEIQFNARQFRVAVLVARFFQRLKTRADNRQKDAPLPDAANDTAHQFRVAVRVTSFWQRLKTRANDRRVDSDPPTEAPEAPEIVKAPAFSTSALSVASETTLYTPTPSGRGSPAKTPPRNGPRRGRNS